MNFKSLELIDHKVWAGNQEVVASILASTIISLTNKHTHTYEPNVLYYGPHVFYAL